MMQIRAERVVLHWMPFGILLSLATFFLLIISDAGRADRLIAADIRCLVLPAVAERDSIKLPLDCHGASAKLRDTAVVLDVINRRAHAVRCAKLFASGTVEDCTMVGDP